MNEANFQYTSIKFYVYIATYTHDYKNYSLSIWGDFLSQKANVFWKDVLNQLNNSSTKTFASLDDKYCKKPSKQKKAV